MDKTVWKDKAKKWEPRNKQAALIFTKAKPFHLPVPKPIIRESLQERLKQESKERASRIKEHEAIAKAKKQESDRKQAAERKRVWERQNKRFRKHQTEKANRLAQKIAYRLGKLS